MAITGTFSQLQMCHENCAKLAGHLAELSSLLQPDQIHVPDEAQPQTPLQISLPPQLCFPANLKFDKLRLTLAVMRKEKGINLMLSRPFHAALAKLPSIHANKMFSGCYPYELKKAHISVKRVTKPSGQTLPSCTKETL